MNKLIQDTIINSPNSYGLDSSGARVQPKYRIVLGPSEITAIREYNQDHPYDDNILVKNNDLGVSQTEFFYGLSKGVIGSYDEDGHEIKRDGVFTVLPVIRTSISENPDRLT